MSRSRNCNCTLRFALWWIATSTKDITSETSAQELNDASIHTLRGANWNPKNLWSFLSLNADLLHDQDPVYTLARPETSSALVCVSIPPKESPIGDLLDWAMRFQTLGIVPVHVSDQELLRRVMRRLEEKGRP